MGGSVILTHWGAAAVRTEGNARVRSLVGRVMRLVGGLLMARHEMASRWRKDDRRIVGRRMVVWIGGLGQRRIRKTKPIYRCEGL